MRFHIVTLFPEFFESPLRAGVPYRAAQAGLVQFSCVNPRDFTGDRHRTVDDYPYGGGPGMILKPEPLVEAVESITGTGNPRGVPVVLLSPQGPRFTQAKAEELAGLDEIVCVCGRYKAVDERVRKLVVTEELSVGDYVLSGGEPACLVLIDTVVRLLPGAIGDQDSAASDSFGPGWRGGLDCAYYTRPPEYRGLQVPEVLLSGHHARIAAWRQQEAESRTRTRRPDLERTAPTSANSSSATSEPET
ncbi:MAG: tRNA (guanosine(37)-N1)-methyltransferase TrmD [Candidatus Krumholzibacteriia bacterium]